MTKCKSIINGQCSYLEQNMIKFNTATLTVSFTMCTPYNCDWSDTECRSQSRRSSVLDLPMPPALRTY